MDLGAGEVYTVKSGDTLSGIANRHGVTTKELANLNDIDNPDQIVVGQKLVLPAYAERKAGGSSETRRPKPAGPGETYVVRAGDTLSEIARDFGTTIAAIKRANNLSGNKILVGQELTVPGGESRPQRSSPPPAEEPAPAPTTRAPDEGPAVEPEPEEMAAAEPEEEVTTEEKNFVYVVSEGDTLESIARDFVVLKEDLLEANDLESGATVEPGDRLVIPIPVPAGEL
jgi:LysM repeat protein